jgi:CheY-like chemotaxis protein
VVPVPVPRRALVVADSAGSRHRVSTLLTLAGYQVLEVVGADAALRSAARFTPDLVVTAVRMRSGDGVALLQQLRRRGSQARFVALTARPDARVHAAVAALGGSCLSTPVDPRQLVDLLRGRTTGPTAQGTTSARLRVAAERLAGARTAAAASGTSRRAAPAPDDDEDGPSWAERQRTIYVSQLPFHLARIADNARAGNASAVAQAAETLAGESGRHGQQDVARVCRSIAIDAERGVLSQPRLMQLVMLASTAH